jgi:hypothetical protein
MQDQLVQERGGGREDHMHLTVYMAAEGVTLFSEDGQDGAQTLLITRNIYQEHHLCLTAHKMKCCNTTRDFVLHC